MINKQQGYKISLNSKWPDPRLQTLFLLRPPFLTFLSFLTFFLLVFLRFPPLSPSGLGLLPFFLLITFFRLLVVTSGLEVVVTLAVVDVTSLLRGLAVVVVVTSWSGESWNLTWTPFSQMPENSAPSGYIMVPKPVRWSMSCWPTYLAPLDHSYTPCPWNFPPLN